MPTIAIVDDRASNRVLFSKLAESLQEDVRVCAFGDPLAALDWLALNQTDLVITDYKMPQLDGADFVRRLRALPDGADIPVVVITVYGDRAFRLEALEAGATDFLQSPIDHSEFLTRTRNLLKLRKQQLLIHGRAAMLKQELEQSERSRELLLRNSRDALAQVIDTVPALISAADRDGRCVFVNAFHANLLGCPAAELVGHDVTRLFGQVHGERSRALDRLVFQTGEAIPSFEEDVVDRDGSKLVYLTTKAPLRGVSNDVVSVLTTSLDITQRKLAESHLRHMAHHDALTDLPNRVLLRQRLENELQGRQRTGRLFALHILDLDRFKAVNDALGHHLGDRLLQEIARRLSATVRRGDTVARLGGDEFAILQTDVGTIRDAAILASRTAAAVAEPYFCDGSELSVSASIGITLYPADGIDVDQLMRNADMAMYRSKAEGSNTYSFFSVHMNVRAQEQMQLEADLRHSISQDQLVLHYQPQVDVTTGNIIGVEALLRWQRPGQGLLLPGDFLPLAEATGLIVPIGQWVIREACRQAMQWRRAGLPPIRLAVNLSPAQLDKQDVCTLVSNALDDSGMDASMLDLELTESILMGNIEAGAVALRGLKQLGAMLSIDDFGTGYASFAYVKLLPVDRLKIDQSFVRGVMTDANDAAIVRATIQLAHSLNLRVMAEGVETAEQVSHLVSEGCNEMQGHFISMPLPAEEMKTFLQRRL